jgi:hypothetical protein
MPPLKRRTVSRALATLHGVSPGSQIDVPDELELLSAPGALELVLGNLLSNAERHAAGSSVSVSAREVAVHEQSWPSTAAVKLKGNAVLLTVADTGPGVLPKIRSRLFEPGVRGRNRCGEGLGLWIARTLVRSHGGDLWLADSTTGAAFVSSWPAVPSPKDDWPVSVEDFGFAVRHARTAAGLPRAQLAKQSGIAEATLRRIELARHRCTGRNRTKLIQTLTDLLTSPAVATP